jgi:hypothetical protein
MQPFKPSRAIAQWSNRSDQRSNSNLSVRDQLDRLRIFPAEAQEPCSRICRETTFCSGSVTCGVMLPTSVTVPPLRTASTAAETVSSRPPLPAPDPRRAPVGQPKNLRTIRTGSKNRHIRARFLGQLQPRGIHIRNQDREHPAARAACKISNPIIPAPITSVVSPPLRSETATA